MDKPLSMSVKEYLTKVMSLKMNIPSSTIDAIISHQFEEANKALVCNDSVEISGFGKFLFKRKKAIKKLEKAFSKKHMFENKLKEEGLSETKINSLNNKLTQTVKDLIILSNKLNGGVETDMGGMA